MSGSTGMHVITSDKKKSFIFDKLIMGSMPFVSLHLTWMGRVVTIILVSSHMGSYITPRLIVKST